jgi:hypothetical protein
VWVPHLYNDECLCRLSRHRQHLSRLHAGWLDEDGQAGEHLPAEGVEGRQAGQEAQQILKRRHLQQMLRQRCGEQEQHKASNLPGPGLLLLLMYALQTMEQAFLVT